jgi:hypothetical protein
MRLNFFCFFIVIYISIARLCITFINISTNDSCLSEATRRASALASSDAVTVNFADQKMQ